MSEDNGTLTQDQIGKIKKWLDDKAANANCTTCGENDWLVAEHLIAGIRFADGGVRLGGAVYPQIALICSNCSFVRYFMANRILAKETEADEAAPTEQTNG